MTREIKRKLPPFVQEISYRGAAYFYFRRHGFKRVKLSGLPWSPEFMRAHEMAMTGQVLPSIGANRRKAGSFAALAASYFASTPFLRLKPSTKGVYRNAIERLCKMKDRDGNEIGDKSATTLQREHVVKLMAMNAEKPESANILRKVIRAMMQHAVETGIRADDPTRDVKAIRVKSDGFHSWSDSEIAQFEQRHAIGTKPRLALALLLYTGQRRSDVVVMGKQHVDKDGMIAVRQIKTGALLAIPVHSELRAIIDATPSGHLTYLVTEFGKPFTAAGFGNWFRDRSNEAGLRHCSAHGLRKAAARRLAEAGCTEHEIAAITGHASLREVQRYTRAADQRRLAVSAMNKTETGVVKIEPLFGDRKEKA
jgi:integrase